MTKYAKVDINWQLKPKPKDINNVLKKLSVLTNWL